MEDAAPASVKKPEIVPTGLDYVSSLEYIDVVSIAEGYDLWIDGRPSEPATNRYFPTVNPATEETLSRVGEAGAEDIDRAVKVARRAYTGVWGRMSGAERAKYLYRLARMLQERSREFSVLETLDGGKPIKESRDIDLPLAAAHFFYYAGWADKLEYSFPGLEPGPWEWSGR